jgi:hypothetical protein
MDKALILPTKKCYWANLLRTFTNNNKLTEKKWQCVTSYTVYFRQGLRESRNSGSKMGGTSSTPGR